MADPAALPASGQYFEAEPTAAAAPRTVAVNIAGLQLEFATDSGVFSPHRLDPGTRLLLLEAPPLAALVALALVCCCCKVSPHGFCRPKP